MVIRKLAFGLMMAGMLMTSVALAQDNAGGQGRGNRGDRGQGGRGDFRAQFQQRIKETLGATDEEWKLLQPKIDNVTRLSMQMRAGSFGNFGGRGGRGGDAAAPTSDVEQKAQALRTTLENKDSKADEVALKVKELRAAREKNREELTKAQAELRELLTPRQEAQLVLMSILD